jgi:hypothetical protein
LAGSWFRKLFGSSRQSVILGKADAPDPEEHRAGGPSEPAVTSTDPDRAKDDRGEPADER